jgi:hypothetical protein
MSWILEEEKLLRTEQNHPREHMDTISVYSLYLNGDSSIDKVVTDMVTLDWNTEKACKYIPKERVLQLIQEKKKQQSHSPIHYIYKDSFMFLVDLGPEHIQSYVKSDTQADGKDSFLVELPVIGDILVPPSIFIFHSMNAVYFIFQEIRSILRKGGSITRKRVLISDDSHNNKTRKNLNT